MPCAKTRPERPLYLQQTQRPGEVPKTEKIKPSRISEYLTPEEEAAAREEGWSRIISRMNYFKN